MPYQVLGEKSGATALINSCKRLAILRSGSGILAMVASTSLSPPADFNSRARSRIAARSSFEKPREGLLLAPVADLCADFFSDFASAMAFDRTCRRIHKAVAFFEGGHDSTS